MKKRAFNLLFISIYTLCIFGISVIYMYLIDKHMLPQIFYIDINDSDCRALMNTIWQVQAAISLLSITLVSLMISKLDIKIYGQSIKEILLLRKFYELSYWDKVVLTIILAVGNLYFVSKGILSGTCIIFVINGFIILIIFKATFEIITESKRYKDKVTKYMENTINEGIEKDDYTDSVELINDLHLHILNLINQNKFIQLNDNINYFIYLYSGVSHKSKKLYSDIERLFDEKVRKIINHIIESEYSFELKSILSDINEKYSHQNIKSLIHSGLRELVESVTVYKNEQEFYKNKIDIFILKLCINKDNESNIMQNQDVSFLLARYYVNLVGNNFIIKETKFKLIHNFIGSIASMLYIDEESDEFFIHKQTIYYISKESVKNNDIGTFGYLVAKLFINNRLGVYSSEINKIFEIITTLNIYLYYAGFKEDYYEDEFKAKIKTFIEATISNGTKDKPNLKMLTNNSNGLFWEHYNNIKNEMHRFGWEFMPMNSVKTCILENVIDEYFAFYSLLFLKRQDLYNLKLNIDKDAIRRILEYFDEEGNLKNKYRQDYEKFCEWYGQNINNKYKNEDFYIHFNKLYKQLLLEKIKEYRNMHEIIDESENNIIKKIKEKVENSIFYSQYIDNKLAKEYAVGPERLDIGVLAKKVHIMGQSLEDETLRAFEKIIYDEIKKNCIHVKYNGYEESKKIKGFFKSIKNIKSNIDSIINRKLSEDFSKTYYESEEDINKLKDFEESKKYLGNLYHNYSTIYLDSSKVDIKINISLIRIRNLSEEEVEKQLELIHKSNNKYEINDMIVRFEKEEAKTYFKEYYKLLEVKCNIYCNVEEQCGVIINTF